MDAADDTLEHNRVRFFEAIDHDDDLIAVLRGHIHVERRLNTLLMAEIPKSGPLLSRLSFFDRVKAARDGGLLSSEATRALLWLNDLRNRFAHTITVLNASDAADAKRRVTREGAEYIDDMLQYYKREADDTRSIVRFAIVSVFSELGMVLDERGIRSA